MNTEVLIQQYHDITSWLNESIGITDVKKTRLPKILECLTELDIEFKKFESGQENKLDSLGKDVDAAVIETISLNTIRHGLATFDKHRPPKEILKQSLLGPFSSLDEVSPDNNARSKLFELEIGAYLLSKGIPVNGFEDVNFNYGSYKVAIQCKRPLLLRNLEDNIAKATQQLKDNNHVDTEKNSVGLVALSLEKLYELDKLKIFQNSTEFEAVIANIYARAEKEILPIWEKKRSIKIIGILLSLKTSAAFQDTKEIKTVNTVVIRCRKGTIYNPRSIICSYLNGKLR